MLDRKHIGYESPPHSVVVDEARLRFFAKAVGETDPIYTDIEAARAAGYQALPAPPTFAFCLNMSAPNPYDVLDVLGIEIGRLLHGEQSFVYHQPISAGDEITFRTRIADIYHRKGGALEFVVRATSATNQHGALVAELTSVTVVRQLEAAAE